MNEPETTKKDAGEEALVEELFATRESVAITPENARFFSSEGNLLSLELTLPGKEPELFERVVVVRTFPVTNPDSFLSVREPDSREHGRGAEIGIINSLSDFKGVGDEVISEELDRRYFAPVILRINSAKDKYGHSYWNCETTAGHADIVISNPYANIRTLEDGRLLIEDMEGNCFYINGEKSLDRASYKRIEIYF